MKKLNIKHFYKRNKGFTLIELILVLGMCSIIILPICSMLDFSLKSCEFVEEKDEVFLNARYGIEYIKEEVKSADIVVSQDKIKNLNLKYPTNIGFLLVFIDNEIYKYVTYHTDNGKLIRVTCDSIKGKYPSYGHFKGYNEICRLVDNIGNTKLDKENGMINLDFNFKYSNNNKASLNIKSDIYIRCSIDC